MRLLISGLFLYSGWVKILDQEAFALAILGYQLLPESWGVPLSALLPWLEFWCAVGLWITPPFRRAAWIWITLMLLVFTLAKISVLQRGLAISCGCSGGDEMMTWKDVGMNMLWLGMSVSGWRWDKRG
ncbi:MauE/DoxX family redox-associated membrane protein [Kiritimatiellaeota bacterium B1221]|nr:MauE/DoxX family redox-associated membrane protein [Kiritimatiellaeota bacterium B1221]